jgi:hypothetical protein
MLAKKTSKNQITLPKRIADRFPATDYFDVRVESGAIILHPVRLGQLDDVRRKLAAAGVSEKDVRDAVRWARRKRR